MKEYFSDEEIKKYTDVIEKFVPDPEHFRKTTDNPFKALGGNLVDMGRVKVIAGLLRKDDQEISSTIRSIEQVFVGRTKVKVFIKMDPISTTPMLPIRVLMECFD